MPIEIRELVIKTEITAHANKTQPDFKDKDFQLIRKQILEECRRMIAENNKEKIYKR